MMVMMIKVPSIKLSVPSAMMMMMMMMMVKVCNIKAGRPFSHDYDGHYDRGVQCKVCVCNCGQQTTLRSPAVVMCAINQHALSVP